MYVKKSIKTGSTFLQSNLLVNTRLLFAYLSLVSVSKQLLLTIFNFCHSVEPKEAIDIVNISNFTGEIDELSMFALLKNLIDCFLLKRMMPYADMLIRNCTDFKK